MEIFDTHFHWYGEPSPKTIIEEAAVKGVKYLLCAGWDAESSERSYQFSMKSDNCWFSCGVHPHDASNFNGDLKPFEYLTKSAKCGAVGEVGLDYFYENSDRLTQLKVLETFAAFALEVKKPLVIHCRDKDNKFDAYSDAYSILKDYSKNQGKFAVHCYTGNELWLEKFLELDSFIGVTGIITFPKAHNVRELVHKIPDNRLLIETDSPYLAPKPYRGKTNFPKYLKEVADSVGYELGKSVAALSSQTTENAFRFFDI